MSSIFNLDAPIWEFMGEIADVVVLSLLWWICSLGIITIGASTTAMYYVLGKKVRQETTYVVKDFFKSFKQNFRQSVPLTLMTIIGYISLFIYLILVFQNLVTDVQLVPNYVLIPITILFAFEFLYLVYDIIIALNLLYHIYFYTFVAFATFCTKKENYSFSFVNLSNLFISESFDNV